MVAEFFLILHKWLKDKTEIDTNSLKTKLKWIKQFKDQNLICKLK